MVTVGHLQKISEIIKCGKKIKLFLLLNETAILFEIFSEH